jgi:hypothetical protein
LSAADVAQIVASVATVTAVVAAILQLRQTHRLAARTIADARRQNCEQRAYDHSARFFSDKAILRELGVTWDFLTIDRKDPRAEDRRWAEYVSKKQEDRFALLAPLNLLEELGSLYKHDLLARDVVLTIFAPTAIELWDDAAWFVRRARRTFPDYFVEWERMVEAFRPEVEESSQGHG